MAYYSCMAIGINRYRYLQPLSYAQDDAQALQRFLVEEAQILFPQECLLLTDASAWVGEQPTYPSRKNILKWLNHEYEIEWESDPPEVLWFFFSGYGVSGQNQDYLMPIDGNPSTPETTGIAMGELFEALRQQKAQKTVVFLDMNRSSSMLRENVLGANTVGLAKEMGISLISSCQLDQYSHESAALGQGLFTSSLIEALRHYRQDLTLADLEQHLHQRLPELCEHHGRPTQTPLFVIPNLEASRQLILPHPGERKLGLETKPIVESTPAESNPVYSSVGESNNHAMGSNASTSVLSNGTAEAKTNSSPIVNRPSDTSVANMSDNSNFEKRNQFANRPLSDPDIDPESTGIPLWQEWLIWGGSGLLVVAAIVAGLFFSKREPSLEVNNQPNESAVTEVAPNPNSNPPDSSEAQRGNEQPEVSAPAVAKVDKATDTRKGRDSREENQAVDNSSQNTAAILAPKPGTKEGNLAILNRAKTFLDGNQATGFKRAIEEASQIPPRTPGYRQATKEMDRWRSVILDISQGRAAQGNYQGAIAAAQLLTEEDPAAAPSLYETARESIETWELKAQQQEVNQTIIAEAQALVIPTQASTYNAAIEKLRQIEAEQPGYQQARELSNQWSEQIYLIANSRASRGNFALAVAAAELVPADSAFGERAAQAITRWKAGQR